MFDWLAAHWADILGVVAAAVVFVDKIVWLTPSKVDDLVLARVKDALARLGVVRPDKPPAV